MDVNPGEDITSRADRDIGVQRTGLEEEQGGHSHLIIVWKAGWQWFYCCKMHLSTTVSGYLK